jgi:hypothetical protein
VKFKSGTIAPTRDGKFVRLAGSVEQGPIEPGMSLQIGFNDALSMTVVIAQVLGDGNPSVLLLECDDPDEAEWMMALNLTDETFDVG